MSKTNPLVILFALPLLLHQKLSLSKNLLAVSPRRIFTYLLWLELPNISSWDIDMCNKTTLCKYGCCVIWGNYIWKWWHTKSRRRLSRKGKSRSGVVFHQEKCQNNKLDGLTWEFGNQLPWAIAEPISRISSDPKQFACFWCYEWGGTRRRCQFQNNTDCSSIGLHPGLEGTSEPYSPTPSAKSTKLDETTSVTWSQVQYVLSLAPAVLSSEAWDENEKLRWLLPQVSPCFICNIFANNFRQAVYEALAPPIVNLLLTIKFCSLRSFFCQGQQWFSRTVLCSLSLFFVV